MKNEEFAKQFKLNAEIVKKEKEMEMQNMKTSFDEKCSADLELAQSKMRIEYEIETE